VIAQLKRIYDKIKQRLFGKLCGCKPKKRGRPKKTDTSKNRNYRRK